jgi:hypothetical protein
LSFKPWNIQCEELYFHGNEAMTLMGERWRRY